MKKPDFFVVGAPKCGTTAMCDYLAQHPEIFFSPIKEPNYFGKDLSDCQELEVKNLEEYLNLFRDAGNKMSGEGSVWSLFSKTAAQEIHDFNPQAKIIIMLRKPVDVVYSLHNQLVYDGYNEDIEDFELAIAAENERRKGLRIPIGCRRPHALLYTDVVKFTDQVQRYIDTFERKNIHIIIYDDFKTDTLKVYRSTLEFLGVSTDFTPKIEVINPSKRVRIKALQNFLIKRPPLIKSLGILFIPRPLRYLMFMTVKTFNTRYEPRPPIAPELRRRLQAEFAPEVERLSQLLGRDLTHWNKA